MKKAFVELCNNVSMTVLLGLGFISQAANFVRGVTTGETSVTVVTPKFPDIFNPITIQGEVTYTYSMICLVSGHTFKKSHGYAPVCCPVSSNNGYDRPQKSTRCLTKLF